MEKAYERVIKMMRTHQAPRMNRLPGKIRVPLREVRPGTRPIMVLELG
jgi:hypothetical protein